MPPKNETADAAPPVADDLEALLRDVRAFLDDPLALLERAADLVRRGDR